MKRRALAIIISLAVIDFAHAQSPPAATPSDSELSLEELRPLALAGDLERGMHRVGFSKERLPLDEARMTTQLGGLSSSTALDLYLWYPARDQHDGRPMSYRDYYLVQESEIPSDETLRSWVYQDMTSPPGVTGETLDRVLRGTMWARHGAASALESYPLVLWSYRDSIPTMQVVLNEYLASHGYVVAFAWPADHAPPLPWQDDLDAETKAGALELQVRILESALDELVGRTLVDADRVAVVSWSYGGESAMELQRRRPEIDFAVGVDSTLVSGWIFRPDPGLRNVPRRDLSVPYLLLKHRRARLGAAETPEPELLSEIPAGAWYVRFNELAHGNFNVPGGMIPGLLHLQEVSSWAVGGKTAQQGYEAVCRCLRMFLGEHLGSGTSLTQQWISGLDPGFVTVVRHPPKSENERGCPTGSSKAGQHSIEAGLTLDPGEAHGNPGPASSVYGREPESPICLKTRPYSVPFRSAKKALLTIFHSPSILTRVI